ncbi:MAG TPA: hypothetical protein VMS92_21720 [Mycobacterium sp.]|nr:hypothetical protein [Mycobacterium sp.]
MTCHHHKCSLRIYGVCDCPVAASPPPLTAQEMINAANASASEEAAINKALLKRIDERRGSDPMIE